MLEFWRRRNKINDERRNEMRRLMADYDRDVYYPAVLALQAECGAAGHKPGSYKTNGFGWSWTECQSCGARVEQWHDSDPMPGTPDGS